MLRQPWGCFGHSAGAALIPGLSLGCGAPSWDPGRTPPCGRVSGTASAGSSRGACDVRLAAVPGPERHVCRRLRAQTHQQEPFQEEPGPSLLSCSGLILSEVLHKENLGFSSLRISHRTV